MSGRPVPGPIDRPDLSHPSRGYLSSERKSEELALGQILKFQN